MRYSRGWPQSMELRNLMLRIVEGSREPPALRNHRLRSSWGQVQPRELRNSRVFLLLPMTIFLQSPEDPIPRSRSAPVALPPERRLCWGGSRVGAARSAAATRPQAELALEAPQQRWQARPTTGAFTPPADARRLLADPRFDSDDSPPARVRSRRPYLGTMAVTLTSWRSILRKYHSAGLGRLKRWPRPWCGCARMRPRTSRHIQWSWMAVCSHCK